MDCITTGVDSAVHNEYRPSGQVAAVTNIVKGEAIVLEMFLTLAVVLGLMVLQVMELVKLP